VPAQCQPQLPISTSPVAGSECQRHRQRRRAVVSSVQVPVTVPTHSASDSVGASRATLTTHTREPSANSSDRACGAIDGDIGLQRRRTVPEPNARAQRQSTVPEPSAKAPIVGFDIEWAESTRFFWWMLGVASQLFCFPGKRSTQDELECGLPYFCRGRVMQRASELRDFVGRG